ncbi:metallophosphoesterase [Aquisalimonas lutea]|uniref:metallophosphoesterase n=1 Tax=Aquisalimonas lutea TaxID=1327750 RepID=UPI0025B38CAE|nr:metallophosphoesterase [Aquisalimonas lutea]MDN3517259.1 metallophosphoesterase [Aquisalimonas lutea]
MIGRAIERLPRNTAGRDFLVSDVHGMVHDLRAALARVAFDPVVDRVVCVGDLVDKGPESVAALRLLNEPWFVSVMGNHDLAAAVRLLEGTPGVDADDVARFRLPTEPWLAGLDPVERAEAAAHIDGLPWLLEIPVGDGRVGVVHAEVPEEDNSWAELRERVERAFAAQSGMGQLAPLVRGRRYLRALKAGQPPGADDPDAVLPDVRHVVHGHTIRGDIGFRPWCVGNRVHIDSGAFLAQPAWHGEWAHVTEGRPGLTLVDVTDPMTPL